MGDRPVPPERFRMHLTAKERETIMQIRYDDAKMVEGWNSALDAAISIINEKYPSDGLTSQTLYEILNEIRDQLAEAKK